MPGVLSTGLIDICLRCAEIVRTSHLWDRVQTLMSFVGPIRFGGYQRPIGRRVSLCVRVMVGGICAFVGLSAVALSSLR